MKFLFPNVHNHSRGFTLIEALIAVLIFSTSLVFLITITARGISSFNQAKSQTTAYFLAQEGLELVHAERDTNSIDRVIGGTPSAWLVPPGSNECEVDVSNGCTIEWVVGGIAWNECPVATGCGRLHMETQSGSSLIRYTHDATGNTESPYSRVITIEHVTNGPHPSYYARVISTVSWIQNGIPRQIKLEEALHEWVTQT